MNQSDMQSSGNSNLAKRIIACLDVQDGVVVKGVRFRDHVVLGSIVDLARRYRDQGVDELVFYDIAASARGELVPTAWIEDAARELDIPFCVAGGIRSVDDARRVLNAGADKISINSPALERPELITEIAATFGVQCVVVGVDSQRIVAEDGSFDYWVYQYTGSAERCQQTGKKTLDWLRDVTARGAGEIVVNCMNQDGTRRGFDLKHLSDIKGMLSVPVVASGGAGSCEDFYRVFSESRVDAALAAGVFHRGELTVFEVKDYLSQRGVQIRR